MSDPPVLRLGLVGCSWFALRCASGFTDSHMAKALRRRTEGTGRMRKLKELPRKAKNGFREGKMAGRGFTCQRLYK